MFKSSRSQKSEHSSVKLDKCMSCSLRI